MYKELVYCWNAFIRITLIRENSYRITALLFELFVQSLVKIWICARTLLTTLWWYGYIKLMLCFIVSVQFGIHVRFIYFLHSMICDIQCCLLMWPTVYISVMKSPVYLCQKKQTADFTVETRYLYCCPVHKIEKIIILCENCLFKTCKFSKPFWSRNIL